MNLLAGLTGIIVSLVLASCSKAPLPTDFGDRKEYQDFGPQNSGAVFSSAAFEEDFTDLKSFRSRMESSSVFDTVSNIYRSRLMEFRAKETKALELSYQILEWTYQLNALEEIVSKGNLDPSVSRKLEEYIDAVRYRDALSLANFREFVLTEIPKSQRSDLRFFSGHNSHADLLGLSKKIRTLRFLASPNAGSLLEALYVQLGVLLESYKKEAPLVEILKETKELLSSTPKLSTFDEELLLKSLKLEDSFYKEEKNYTTYKVGSSAYIETALGLYGGDVFQTWSDTFQSIRIQVKEAFTKVKLKMPEPTAEDMLHPENVILNLQQELSMLGDELLDLGVEPIAVSQVRKQIAGLDPLIFFVVSKMEKMNPEIRLAENVVLFTQVVDRLEEGNLFPPAVISKVKNEVAFPAGIQALVRLIEQEGTNHELRLALSQTILIRLWRYMRARVEAELIGLVDRSTIKACVARYQPYVYGVAPMLGLRKDKVDCDASIPSSVWDRYIYKLDRLAEEFDNPFLVYGLSVMSEEDLDWMSRVDEDNLDLQESFFDYLSPIASFVSSVIKSEIEQPEVEGVDVAENDYSRVKPYVLTIEKAVNTAFLKKIALRLTDELSQFDKIVENSILKSIDAVDFLPRDFYHHLKGIAKAELSSKILGESEQQDSLPLFEARHVYTAHNLDEWEFRAPESNRDSLNSGSNVVTSSASSKILGFWFLENLKGNPGYDFEVASTPRKRSFDLVNKLVNILGYRDYFGSLEPGLVVNAKSRVPKRLDIYTYAYENEFFGIPDEFLLDRESSRFDLSLIASKRSFSIESQARLLQMSADFMDLMADWKQSPLDDSLHKITYQGVKFFPKESLIELGLGMSSIVLRNLLKGGLVLFDKERNELVLNTGEDSSALASKVMSATVVGIHGEKTLTTVSLEGLSRYMVALYDFLKSSESLDYSRSNSMIYLSSDTGESVRVELSKAINLLRKLYIGMANFLSSRMMNSNKLFVEEYDYETDVKQGMASLIDQNTARLALLRAYNLWDAEIYLWAAIDNLRANLKLHMNPRTGLLMQAGAWAPEVLSSNLYSMKALLAEPRLGALVPSNEIEMWKRILVQHEKALLVLL